MHTSEVIYIKDLRTEATHMDSGNCITTDAPKDNHGNGEFFSPTDLLATSLASCMLTIMGLSAQTHGFSIDGAKAKVLKIMESNPRRLGEIVIDIWFPANDYSSKEKTLLKLAADTCPVAKSLHPDIKQIINFHFEL